MAECYLQLAISDFFVHSPFDRHTAADREAGIFADFLIEELAAERKRTILSTGYYFSDIGSRNRKVAVRSVAGGWTVMFGTFGRIPVSSFPRGYRLWSCSMKRICVNCVYITCFYTCVSCCATPSELWFQAVLEYNVMSIKIEVSSFGNFWLSANVSPWLENDITPIFSTVHSSSFNRFMIENLLSFYCKYLWFQ